MTLKQLFRIFLCAAVLALAACSKNKEDDLLKYGAAGEAFTENQLMDKDLTALWSATTNPDADSPMTISFRAGKDSPLRDFKGEVYAHIGVIQFGVWTYVKAGWPNPEDAESMIVNNREDCRFVKDEKEANLWHIHLKPTVREFFNDALTPIGETPITQLGLVIRNADGTKKGIAEDRFIRITDNRYKEFVPAQIEMKSLPANCFDAEGNVLYGPNTESGSITFVLHDEDTKGEHRDFAYIVGDFNDWKLSNNEDAGSRKNSEMFRDEAAGCWWITVSNLDPAKEYRYQYHVGDVIEEGYMTLRISDAFSEKILHGENDKWINYNYQIYPEDQMQFPAQAIDQVSCVKINRDAYSWTPFEIRNPESLVVYEMLLGDFTKEGSLKAAMEKLDYLKTLGINAVELMPIQEFDGNESWGYNPTHYFALDKAYGTRKDYKDFIDACHQKGIAVIVDVVYNHNTGASPIAKLYWDSKKNKTAANNPYFNVDAPHAYSVFHDLNHNNEFVKQLVKRSLRYLVEEYNVDGFRFDLTKGFAQDSNTDGHNAGRMKIALDYNAYIKAFDRELGRNTFVIFEHLGAWSEESEYVKAGIHPWLKVNSEYCQTAEGRNSSFKNVYPWLDGNYNDTNEKIAATGWVGYMESHDEERMAYKAMKYGIGGIKEDLGIRMEQLALNAVCFLTVPGPKMIWQMGELGYDYNKWCTPEGIDKTDVKEYETSRKPVKWDYLDVPERKALYDVYCKLNALRNNNPELFGNDAYCTFDFDSWPLRNLYSECGGRKLQVYANFSGNGSSTQSVTVPSGTWKDYFTGETVSGTRNLASGDFLVLVSPDVQ